MAHFSLFSLRADEPYLPVYKVEIVCAANPKIAISSHTLFFLPYFCSLKVFKLGNA